MLVISEKVAVGQKVEKQGQQMADRRFIEIAVVVGVLAAGAFLFVRMITLADTVPAEYRSASPGFGWSWDFDYEAAMREAGRLGAAPWPWPAVMTGNRMVLPLGQTLSTGELEITYRGLVDADRFRLDVVVRNLDSRFPYPREFEVERARTGIRLGDRRFRLAKVTRLYLLMYSDSP